MTNKDETNHQRDRLIDELFFAEDNEVIDLVGSIIYQRNLWIGMGLDLYRKNSLMKSGEIRF